MSRLFKSIAREFATEAGVEICRGYMIERLREVTPKDLHKAIKEGTHTLSVSEDKDRNFGKKWSRVIERFSYEGKRLQRNLLTAENVLEWLKQDRPDLGSLIINMNPEGMNWLKEDVKQVYAFLFSPQQKPVLTLVKREQPKEDIGTEQAARLTEREKTPETQKEAQTEEKPTDVQPEETPSQATTDEKQA